MDFFAGIGGFRKGFELCGMRCVGHCEIDKYADRSYRAIHDVKEDEWYAADITKVAPADLPRADLWAGGFPCQDISVAGRQRGLDGARSGLFFTLAQLVKGHVRFDGYLTDVFSNKAAEFIKESSQPFLLYLAYNAVHTPMQATPEDLKRFEGHPRQKLAAMTFALDRGIGTVINSLKESGKLDNTLIFFLSDNGGATTNTSSNEPLKGFKGNKFEGGHRIPFFIVWKNKIESNIKFEGLSSSLDIFTTALDAANIKKSKHKLDGVSLIPYLRKQKKGNPHSVLYWRKMDTRAIRMGDYKLIITHGVDSVLYNVKEDIGETHNLIHERPDLYKKMAKKMYQWEKEICIDPLWIETGWGRITNNYHKRLMHNEIKTAADLKK